jgi:hypothetical protein
VPGVVGADRQHDHVLGQRAGRHSTSWGSSAASSQ